MQREFEGTVEVIGVSGRDDLAAMERFVDQRGVGNFAHVADLDGEIWATYRIGTQPAWVFINDDGSSTTRLGGLGEAVLRSEIETLLTS